MAFLVALIVAVGVAYLVWKAFGPQSGQAASGPSRRGPIGPDDDPDFLLDLGSDRRSRSRGATPRREEPQAPTPEASASEDAIDGADPDATDRDGPTGGAGRRDDPRPGTTA